MMSNLVEYAETELRRAGFFDKDSDYDGMLGESVLELVKKFAEQGHSGASATMTVDLAERLMRFEPLTPLTGEADEWNDVSDVGGHEGGPIFQNKRYSSVFMEDGEAYDIGAVVAVDPSGGTWTGPRKKISFPYTPEHEQVQIDAHGRGSDGEEIMPGFCDDDGCNCWRGGEKLQLEGDVL
jgi:hypothetical protein